MAVSKRSFYSDDELTTSIPGFVEQEIPKDLEEKESPHLANSEISIFEGMTIRSPLFLQHYVTSARQFLHEKLSSAELEYQTSKSALQNEIRQIETSFREVVVEPTLPNIIYIITSALTGSILVNRRSLPVRFITPVIFGTVAYKFSMPASYNNTKNLLSEYEKNFPEVYETHKQANQNIDQFKAEFEKTANDANQELINSVAKARKYLKDITSSDISKD